MKRIDWNTEELKKVLKENQLITTDRFEKFIKKEKFDYHLEIEYNFPSVVTYFYLYLQNGVVEIPFVPRFTNFGNFGSILEEDLIKPVSITSLKKMKHNKNAHEKNNQNRKESIENRKKIIDFILIERKTTKKKQHVLYALQKGIAIEKIISPSCCESLHGGYILALKEGNFFWNGEKMKPVFKKEITQMKKTIKTTEKGIKNRQEVIDRLSFILEKNRLRMLFGEREEEYV